jgi:hypothetical protein
MKIVVAGAALLALGACGTTTSQRGLSGAALGAGVGLLGGPVGVAAGAALGAGAGIVTDEDDLYLGEPVWD